MLKINLVFLGHFKVFIDRKKIKAFKSKIFEIVDVSEQVHVNNADSYPYLEFTDETLKNDVITNLETTPNTVNVLVCWLPLEDNWYVRILDEKTVVISLYETGDILMSHHISIENFILKNILKLSTLYNYLGGKLSSDGYSLAHDEIRKCLFDMNYDKSDIIFNTNSANVCSECTSKFDKVKMPTNFHKNLVKELKKLKKDTFYRIYDFIQSKPKVSILIGFIFAIAVNIISSYIYDYLKNSCL